MYPTWRYHPTLPACVVDTPEADDALGAGWADTPAAFEDAECSNEKTKTKKKKANLT